MKSTLKLAGAALLALAFVAPAMAQTTNGDTTTNVAPGTQPGSGSGTAGMASKGVGGGAPATTNTNVTGGTQPGAGSAGSNTGGGSSGGGTSGGSSGTSK